MFRIVHPATSRRKPSLPLFPCLSTIDHAFLSPHEGKSVEGAVPHRIFLLQALHYRVWRGVGGFAEYRNTLKQECADVRRDLRLLGDGEWLPKSLYFAEEGITFPIHAVQGA